MVVQIILQPAGSIWIAGDGAWRVGGGIYRDLQISDNLDFKPENYLRISNWEEYIPFDNYPQSYLILSCS